MDLHPQIAAVLVQLEEQYLKARDRVLQCSERELIDARAEFKAMHTLLEDFDKVIRGSEQQADEVQDFIKQQQQVIQERPRFLFRSGS